MGEGEEYLSQRSIPRCRTISPFYQSIFISITMAESMPKEPIQSKDERHHIIASSLERESSGAVSLETVQIGRWRLIPIIGSLWLGTMLVAIDNTIIGSFFHRFEVTIAHSF
jgi:hypothetical protein